MEFRIVAKTHKLANNGENIDIKFFRDYFGKKFRAFCMVDVRAKNGDVERFAFYRSSGTNPKVVNGEPVKLGGWLPIYGIAQDWIYKITTPCSIEGYDNFIYNIASKLEDEFLKEMEKKRCLNKFPLKYVEEFNSIFKEEIKDNDGTNSDEQVEIAKANRLHKANRYLELIQGDE